MLNNNRRALLVVAVALVLATSHETAEWEERPARSLGRTPARNLDGLVNRFKHDFSCSLQWGCWMAKCWRYCHPRFPAFRDWCYTTMDPPEKEEDADYVECWTEADCERCWRCGGSCST